MGAQARYTPTVGESKGSVFQCPVRDWMVFEWALKCRQQSALWALCAVGPTPAR